MNKIPFIDLITAPAMSSFGAVITIVTGITPRGI